MLGGWEVKADMAYLTRWLYVSVTHKCVAAKHLRDEYLHY